MRMRQIFSYIIFSLAAFVLILFYHVYLVNYFENIPIQSKELQKGVYNDIKKIEIWSKASIGDYLWAHIMGGDTEVVSNGFFRVGTLHLHDMEFTFRGGPGYIQTTVPQDVSHLVLVINGRTPQKIVISKQWLDYLPKLKKLRKTAVVLLGNEECENNWILPYLRSRGGILDLLFLVYDSPLVDNKEIFQWPLGVATYRGFPKISPTNGELEVPRSFKCNFVGTVYQNSSRQILEKVLDSSEFQHNCFISTRTKWLPNETKASLARYVEALSNSDLTLSPVGKNTECYRIYEAMSYGSIPIVEDLNAKGRCSSPLRLLRTHNAPIIYIKDWKKLGNIFALEKNITNIGIVDRRKHIIQWYTKFKKDICKNFLETVNSRFYH